MKMIQSPNQAIDISAWRRDQEYEQYPEGARVKTLLYCPSPPPYTFLKKEHRYLFKLSSHRYPEQFWVEILAYLLGLEMGISVPPAFVAYDHQQSGALIEWFLNPIPTFGSEIHISGGDLSQQYIPDFDRKKGKKHNFGTITTIFENLTKKPQHFNIDWINYWARTFTFDALIGNTDRHQDNWGVILNLSQELSDQMRITPVFDNGTSMGHEISSRKFKLFESEPYIRNYVTKGWHHMRWQLNDINPMGHIDMLKKIISKYPKSRYVMIECLSKVNSETFKSVLNTLAAFDVPVRLAHDRSIFMLRLLEFRHTNLLRELENYQ